MTQSAAVAGSRRYRLVVDTRRRHLAYRSISAALARANQLHVAAIIDGTDRQTHGSSIFLQARARK